MGERLQQNNPQLGSGNNQRDTLDGLLNLDDRINDQMSYEGCPNPKWLAKTPTCKEFSPQLDPTPPTPGVE